MTLAREGWEIVAAVAAAAVLGALFGGWWSLPLWVFLLFVLQFFRDPKRVINTSAAARGGVLSAADGRVVWLGAGQSPLDGSARLKISVFMNVFNVHANRAPIAGTVTRSQRFGGSFFNAALDKASEKNERHVLVINAGAHEVTAVQIAGLLARRVLCYAVAENALFAGQRYGFIRFGSRVDLYLPPDSTAKVQLGQRVIAGVSVVAELPPDDADDEKDRGDDHAAA